MNPNINDDILCKQMAEKELNGAILPQVLYRTNSTIEFNKNQLMEMLKYEDELRKSIEIIEICDNACDYFETLRNVDKYVRERVLQHFGYKPDVDDSFKAYQIACGEYMNDPEVRECVVWMKYDKARLGNLKVNQPTPLNVEIFDLLGCKMSIQGALMTDRVNVVISGSIS
jgi:hypothetical protein